MLAWFKKKFGKKNEAETPPQQEQERSDLDLGGQPAALEAIGEATVEEQRASTLAAPASTAAAPEADEVAISGAADTAAEEPPTLPLQQSPVVDAVKPPSEPVLEELASPLPIEPDTEPAPAACVPESEISQISAEEEQRERPPADASPLEVSPAPAAAAEDLESRPQEHSSSAAGSESTSASAQQLEAPLAATQEKAAGSSFFRRLQQRLGKTRDSFVYQLDRIFLGKKEIDQELFDQLEEILITADLGVATTMELLDYARKRVKREQLSDPQALKNILRDQILAYISASEQPAELVMPKEGPFVIMVVGVNGVGKTTTIGKIAAKFARSGQSTLMVAGDTFRAAAIDQLKIWGQRVGVQVFAQQPGADPSSVVFDSLAYGVAQDIEVILIDTAGRLHTSVNLMEELKKIKRVIGKKLPGAPHEVLLVLDATTGQNSISQAKLFHQAVGVSGLALTKLDGTAKGGIVANVCRELNIPVRFIGIGEQIDDLRDFDAQEFVEALFTRQAG